MSGGGRMRWSIVRRREGVEDEPAQLSFSRGSAAQTGLLVRQFEAADEVWSVTFSPDGRRLLVASQAGLTIWDVRDFGTNVAGRLK